MTTYAVFEPNAKGTAPAAVADRFSWFAAILPPVYMLVHGLWLVLLGYIVVVAALGAAGNWIGDDVSFWLYVLFALWIGFEASGLRRAALSRRGWRYRADIIASATDLAQVEWLKQQRANA